MKKVSLSGFFYSGKNRVFPDLIKEEEEEIKKVEAQKVIPNYFHQNYSKIAMVSDFLTNEEVNLLLQKMLDILEPLVINENPQLSEDDAEELACCLDTFFTPITTVNISSFQFGNSAAYLVTRGTDLLVLKEHRFINSNPWLYHFNVILEVYMSLLLFQKFPNNDYFPNLVHIHMNKTRINIITLYIPVSFNDIFTYKVPQNFIRKRAVELFTAVYFLHEELKVAHRDIKAQNTRMKSNGQLVLLDFDTCCPKSDSRWLTRPVTSAHTRAPELEINPNKEGKNTDTTYNAYACDIFSCGCVILEMILMGNPPFKYKEEDLSIRLRQIKQFSTSEKVKSQVEEKAGKLCFDLLKKMLHYDPLQRPTIKECLLHPYITSPSSTT